MLKYLKYSNIQILKKFKYSNSQIYKNKNSYPFSNPKMA